MIDASDFSIMPANIFCSLPIILVTIASQSDRDARSDGEIPFDVEMGRVIV